MICAFAANIAPLKNELLFSELYGKMAPLRKEKIESMRLKEDKLRSLGVGVLLQKALLSFGIDYYNAEFFTDENGKEHIKNDPVFFSLSHSGDLVMCAVSNDLCGCDIEYIDKYKESVVKRFFHQFEISRLEKIAEENLLKRGFYNIWTGKESFVKAVGLGLRISPEAFAIMPESTSPVFQSVSDRDFFVRCFDVFDDYSCSVCSACMDLEDLEIKIVDLGSV